MLKSVAWKLPAEFDHGSGTAYTPFRAPRPWSHPFQFKGRVLYHVGHIHILMIRLL